MSALVLILIQVVAASAVFLVQYLGPGLFIVTHSPLKKLSISSWERLTLSVLLSLSIQALIFFLLSTITGRAVYAIMFVFFALGIASLPQLYRELQLAVQAIKKYPLLAAFTAFCILSLASTLFLTWIPTRNGLSLQSGQLHDSVWHLALVNNLQRSFPPEHPAYSAATVANYHYFYDIILAIVSHNFALPTPVLYFQFFPLVLASLLAASVVMAAKRLHSLALAYPTLFLTFFGGSLAYLIPLFLPGNTWTESSFWVSQTFASMGNPQIIFSLATTSFILWLLLVDEVEMTPPVRAALHAVAITIIVAGIGFKSYGWLVMGALYGSYLVFKFVVTRSWQYGLFALAVILCSLPVVWLITGFQTSSFFWHPLWYLTSMIEAPDRVFHPIWRLQEDTFRAEGSWWWVAYIRFKEFVIFITGNLGTRLVLFALPLIWWKQSPNRKLWLVILSLSVATLFSAGFPLLFLQRGAVWNSIQFWYYTLIFANFLAGLSLLGLLSWLKTPRWLAVVGVIIIIICSVPTYLQTQLNKLAKHEVISAERLKTLAAIPPQSHVFICPTGTELFKTSFATAYTGTSIYFANPVQLSITGDEKFGTSEEERLVGVMNDPTREAIKAIIREHGITHFLCDNPDWYPIAEHLSQESITRHDLWYLARVGEPLPDQAGR